MKHAKLKDYLFFSFLITMAFMATKCKPEVTEVWPFPATGLVEDSLAPAPPCDSTCEEVSVYYQIKEQSNENNNSVIPCDGVCSLQEAGR